MPTEKTPEEEIAEAVHDVQVAMLRNMTASRKLVEVNNEKTAAHYALQKANQRLWDLQLSLR